MDPPSTQSLQSLGDLMPIYVLNDSDRRLIEEFLSAQRNHPQNPPVRNVFPTTKLEYLPPECYVARPQTAGGIAARSGTTPGQAECDIFRIHDVSGTPTLQEITGFDKTVYNISADAIDQDYIPVARDKYGKWIAMVGAGGGGSQIIHFSIQSVDCVTRCAIGTVLARICGDTDVGDDISIYDAAGCFFTGNETLLVGVKGYAVLMDGDDPCPGTGTWVGTGTTGDTPTGCVWHVFSLCCPTEVC